LSTTVVDLQSLDGGRYCCGGCCCIPSVVREISASDAFSIFVERTLVYRQSTGVIAAALPPRCPVLISGTSWLANGHGLSSVSAPGCVNSSAFLSSLIIIHPSLLWPAQLSAPSSVSCLVLISWRSHLSPPHSLLASVGVKLSSSGIYYDAQHASSFCLHSDHPEHFFKLLGVSNVSSKMSNKNLFLVLHRLIIIINNNTFSTVAPTSPMFAPANMVKEGMGEKRKE
jgi:hypothetical protein